MEISQLKRKMESPILHEPKKVKSATTNPKNDFDLLLEYMHPSYYPDGLVCREKEKEKVTKFLVQCLKNKNGGSLYISGSPGTGKTALIEEVMKLEKEKIPMGTKMESISFNCMDIPDLNKIWKHLCLQIDPNLTDKEISWQQLFTDIITTNPNFL
jgi:Cdc6-like AAA superfamily ATPase